tara:strand:- start:4676 stop:5545 length:870 start_codon:yes stop_codon:yes gene_type:complete
LKKLVLILLLIVYSYQTIAQNKALYFQTSWGFEGTTEAFIKKAKASGFDGIEIWSPTDKNEQIRISKLLKEENMKVIYLCGSDPNLSFEKGLAIYKKYLKNTFELNPMAINSHTGSDFYSFNQNMAFLEEATKLSKQYEIPIYHETHRGRFSYSLPKTIEYLEKNKDLVLTLDVSHWIVVHESLLLKRADLLKKIINRTNHIHARVGFEEGPQVNDPSAPEWKTVVERHIDIWSTVIQKIRSEKKIPTITTEFGPPNYMPTLPITQEPTSDQWLANLYIMKMLKKRLKE